MSTDKLNIQHWLKKHSKFRPNHTAIIVDEKRLTYNQLYEEVNRLSNAFIAEGINKGDKVATLLSNSIELYEIYWACASIGAIVVPLSPLLRGEGLYNLLENSETKLVITSSDLLEHIDLIRGSLKYLGSNKYWVIDAHIEDYKNYHLLKQNQNINQPNTDDINGDEPYNIIYSSGTTGLPKGIVISHAVRALYGTLFANSFRITAESIVMHSGSIIFNGSFLTLMPAMFLGCTYILMKQSNPQDIVNVIQKEKVTHTILVPSQIISCLQIDKFSKQYLNSLECIISVGAPLLLEHKEELNKRIPNVFYELYGLTEGFMTILDKNDVLKKTGSVGTVPQFMDLKILNENDEEMNKGQIGEIVGKGPLMMTEYYKNPEQTKQTIKNGWLYTGDFSC